jgi:hypothetical protein
MPAGMRIEGFTERSASMLIFIITLDQSFDLHTSAP